MSKYKVLWIDDKYEELSSFKDLCELPKNNIKVVACNNAEEGMEIFEDHLEEWSGVILDAKVFKTRNSQIDKLDGLSYSIKRILELSHKRYVPYYIFTGQPDLSSSSSFAEEHEDNYYEKDKDEQRLIGDIIKNADKLLETQVMRNYKDVISLWPQCKAELLRTLIILEKHDWTNNSVFNDIWKILTDVVKRLFDCGILSVYPNATNLNECSRMLGQSYMEMIIPVYVQRSIHSCVSVTNSGSHRTQSDKDVKDGNAPYLVRSMTYELLNILQWCKNLPSKSERQNTINKVEAAKTLYEMEYSEKKNKNKYK